MKILQIIVLAIAAVSAAFAQTAKVVPLSPADAAKAKELHEAVKTAQEASDKFDMSIYLGYTTNIPKDYQDAHPELGFRLTVKQGWEAGFEYSEDFLFIVPKPLPKSDYMRYGSGSAGTKGGTYIGSEDAPGTWSNIQMYACPNSGCLPQAQNGEIPWTSNGEILDLRSKTGQETPLPKCSDVQYGESTATPLWNTQNTGGQMYPEESTPFTRCLRDPNCIASIPVY